MEKKIAFIASVAEREQQLKIVIESIITKVDLIHLVLNFYKEVPDWLKGDPKIFVHLNPTNKNAHDSIWTYVEAENTVLSVKNHNGKLQLFGNYYFVLDDDLNYPQNYFDKLIETIEKYDRKMVVAVHGAIVSQPVESYFKCRNTFGFSNRLINDIHIDMPGCNTTAFHSSTIKPTLQDFPIPFMRDLWLSILCRRNNVSIMCVARPVNWVTSLVTSGDTVYDETLKNKTLFELKNRVLKEVFLPLLFCNKRNDKYCLITDYDFDQRLLTKSLQTLACVVDCNRVIFSNKVQDYGFKTLMHYVTSEDVEIGRMGSKVVTQYRFIKGLPDGLKVISADADLYYLKDPFTAFEQDFDIAVTTRCDQYHYPINGGVVMFRTSDKVRNFLDYVISQIFERTWPELIEWQKKFNHQGNDWYIDQDIWCLAWLYREGVLKEFGVKIIDVGPDYNFCPHADGNSTFNGKHKLMIAHNNHFRQDIDSNIAVLHLKSRLRELLFDGLLK